MFLYPKCFPVPNPHLSAPFRSGHVTASICSLKINQIVNKPRTKVSDIYNIKEILYLTLILLYVLIKTGRICCLRTRFVPYPVNLNTLKNNANLNECYDWYYFIHFLIILHIQDHGDYFISLLNDYTFNSLISNVILLLEIFSTPHGTFKNILKITLILNFAWQLLSLTSILYFIYITKVLISGLSYLHSTIWLPFLLIILSNDIELNPGPPIQTGGFNFAHWNINSLGKDEFSRVNLLQAQNAIHNYDIISLCETSLNDEAQIPNPLMEGYEFKHLNHPSGDKRGGVGIFYKETLPLTIKSDFNFDECLVCEIRLGNRKIFYSVIYRSPSNHASSPEFHKFLTNFEDLTKKIRDEKPYASFYVGDFNAHCQNWWPEGNTNAEGVMIDQLASSLGLEQLISDPTNFEPGRNPSCIDLIFCDQPNIVLESGTRPSPDTICKHQVIFGRLNLHIPPLRPYFRKIWHYNKANTNAIKQSISCFDWTRKLANRDPSWQIALFNKTLLNIMSNFIPNEYTKVQPKDPPWINNTLRRMIKRQNRQYKNFVNHGCKSEDKVRVDNFRKECFEAVNKSKEQYFKTMGLKLADSQSSPKTYWTILKKLVNKTHMPRIPPILKNNKLITDCREKASLFNEYFLSLYTDR